MKIFEHLFTWLFLSASELFKHFTFFMPSLLINTSIKWSTYYTCLIDVFIAFDLNLYDCSKLIWIKVIITGCKNMIIGIRIYYNCQLY